MGKNAPLQAVVEEEEKSDGPGIRRLNLNLSSDAYNDLVSLSKATARSMTELVRLGLGLVKIAIDVSREGHKLFVTDKKGKILRELVLPR